MTPADKLLSHFDRVAGSVATFRQVCDEGVRPEMHVAIYRGFPESGAMSAFTMGLSHFHPPGGTYKELMISMRDTDEAWALACGFLACQLRDNCPFVCGDAINFRAQIADSSLMSAFVVVHPIHISSQDSLVDIGTKPVEIVQLVPLYESERAWLMAGGHLKTFLDAYPPSAFMDPQRKSFSPGNSRPVIVEPGAAPNGGPATQFGDSEATEGPPSVS